jgi:hypothetical protein
MGEQSVDSRLHHPPHIRCTSRGARRGRCARCGHHRIALACKVRNSSWSSSAKLRTAEDTVPKSSWIGGRRWLSHSETSHRLRNQSAGVSGTEVHSPPTSRNWPIGESTRWIAVASSTRSWHLGGGWRSAGGGRHILQRSGIGRGIELFPWHSSSLRRMQRWDRPRVPGLFADGRDSVGKHLQPSCNPPS